MHRLNERNSKHTYRGYLEVRWIARLGLICNLQSIFASMKAACRKTLQDVNRGFWAAIPCPKNSVETYMPCKVKQCTITAQLPVVLTGVTAAGTRRFRKSEMRL